MLKYIAFALIACVLLSGCDRRNYVRVYDENLEFDFIQIPAGMMYDRSKTSVVSTNNHAIIKVEFVPNTERDGK